MALIGVPVSEAYELEKILKRSGSEYQMKIFRGEGHRLTGLYQLEAGLLIAGFLTKHLRTGTASKATAQPSVI